MSWANIISFFMGIILNPFAWAFIIFWAIYRKNQKRWAKITAIILTVIGAMTIITSCYHNLLEL